MSRDDYAAFLASKAVKPEHRGFAPTLAMSPALFPFQRDSVAWAIERGRAALFFDCGLGKAQPIDAPVLTPAGWREIGTLRVGDQVVSERGRPVTVTGVFPQGRRAMFRVHFDDGAHAECDGEHLWRAMTDADVCQGRRIRVLTLNEIVAIGIKDCVGRNRWQIQVVRPVRGTRRSFKIDPYVLGVLLGDGHLAENGIWFTSADEFIAKEVERRLHPSMRLHREAGHDRCPNYRLSTSVGRNHNTFMRRLRAYGLHAVDSLNKFIPDAYLMASVEQRMDLLRGLLDTDGYIATDGGVDFNTSSQDLARDVVALIRSLGGIARLRSKTPTYRHRGVLLAGAKHYRIRVQLPADIGAPFLLPRKVARYKFRPKYQPCRKIASVEAIGDREAVCIAVDSNAHLYVTSDYIVTHNTACQLEWARHVAAHTGRPALILAPLAVSSQTEREGAKFGIDVAYARDASEVVGGIVITNYERLDRFDARAFGGVVLDESSILKAFSGSTKQRLISAFEATPFKLACTATPAPNDHLELGNHAEFLGVLTSHEMIARWFITDQSEFGTYRLKGHAVEPFWNWVTSWARCAGTPSDLGAEYSDDGYVLPPLRMHTHVVDSDLVEGRGTHLFRIPDLSATSVHKEKRLTVGARAAKVAELVAAESAEPWLVWCDTDYEADALMEVLPEGAVEVRGTHSPEFKESALLAFADGTTRVLVTKSRIAGYGMNYQSCARQAFVGASFSFEQVYQAIRRSWRFGQARAVDVHVAMAQTELAVWQVFARKQAEHEAMKREMFAAARRAQAKEDNRKERYAPSRAASIPSWLRSA